MTGDKFDQDPSEYEIVVHGRLDKRWASRFGEMTVTALPNGATQICGPVTDQAALHGILNRIRDLGLVLISVQQKAGSGS